MLPVIAIAVLAILVLRSPAKLGGRNWGMWE
jgi:hypothetical protein